MYLYIAVGVAGLFLILFISFIGVCCRQRRQIRRLDSKYVEYRNKPTETATNKPYGFDTMSGKESNGPNRNLMSVNNKKISMPPKKKAPSIPAPLQYPDIGQRQSS